MTKKIDLETQLFSVNEIYDSIEGEGVQAGKLTTFIRFSGCNLACKWCDSKYALAPGRETRLMTTSQIMERVRHSNITLTGGEPLFRDGIHEFMDYLLKQGYNVNLETNGSLFIGAINTLKNRKRLTVMMDYKSTASNNRPTTCLKNLDCLQDWDAVKFVIASEADFQEFMDIWNEYIGGRGRFYSGSKKYKVFLSSCFQEIFPQDLYRLQAAGLENTKFKKEYEERVRLQLQMHKYIWPPELRGV